MAYSFTQLYKISYRFEAYYIVFHDNDAYYYKGAFSDQSDGGDPILSKNDPPSSEILPNGYR